VAYLVGGTGMALVTGMAWRGLVEPVKVEEEKKTL
jgi:hypothetical protein